MIYSIRGACTAKEDSAEAISEAAVNLYREILSQNEIAEESIVNLLISHTKDLRTLNSATALRRAGYCSSVPLFCVQEADIEGSLPSTIRMMLTVQTEGQGIKPRHVYLGEARKLRPDIKG